jgi:hypothetical protein
LRRRRPPRVVLRRVLVVVGPDAVVVLDRAKPDPVEVVDRLQLVVPAAHLMIHASTMAP